MICESSDSLVKIFLLHDLSLSVNQEFLSILSHLFSLRLHFFKVEYCLLSLLMSLVMSQWYCFQVRFELVKEVSLSWKRSAAKANHHS